MVYERSPIDCLIFPKSGKLSTYTNACLESLEYPLSSTYPTSMWKCKDHKTNPKGRNFLYPKATIQNIGSSMSKTQVVSRISSSSALQKIQRFFLLLDQEIPSSSAISDSDIKIASLTEYMLLSWS